MSSSSLSENLRFADSIWIDPWLSPKRDIAAGRAVEFPLTWVGRSEQRAFNGLARRRDEVPFTWRAMPLEISS